MTTDHRAEAERLLRHRNVSRAWPHIALHAIDRLADALAARLPQTPTTEAEGGDRRHTATTTDILDKDLRFALDKAQRAARASQDATGPQEAGGRIGWLRLRPTYSVRLLAREVEGGWSSNDHVRSVPEWTATNYPDAVFTPINPPSSAPATPAGDDEPDQAPVDPQAAPGPQKSAGRIGWLRLDSSFPFRYLARKVEGGWSGVDYDHNNGTPGWIDKNYPGATFTPLLDGFYVALDAGGQPTILRETDGNPEWVMVRTPYNADLFDVVAGLLETREEA